MSVYRHQNKETWQWMTKVRAAGDKSQRRVDVGGYTVETLSFLSAESSKSYPDREANSGCTQIQPITTAREPKTPSRGKDARALTRAESGVYNPSSFARLRFASLFGKVEGSIGQQGGDGRFS